MEDKFVENLLALNALNQKLKVICAELDKTISAFCGLDIPTPTPPQTLSPEDYD